MSSDPTTTFPATSADDPATAEYYVPPSSDEPKPPTRPHERGWLPGLLVAVWSLLLAILAFAPILVSRGVVIRGEMVFVPRQALSGTWLGLDGWVHGAVPADFFVSLFTTLIPGDIVQKVALLAILVIAGSGMGALLVDRGLVARFAGATFYIWNPFVYERLMVGDWTLLLGYAALPWVLWAARRVSLGSLGELGPVVAFLALAGWANPATGVIGLVLAVVVVARRNGRAAGLAAVAGIIVNLPWILPGLFRPGGATGSAEAAEAFAATAETPLGVIGSLLGLGGVWDPGAFTPGRDVLVMAILGLILTAVGLYGAVLAAQRWDSRVVTGVGVLAAIGLVIAILGGLESTRSVVEGLADSVPGGGIFADGHALLVPFALLLAVGYGTLAGIVGEWAWVRGANPMLALVGVVAVAIPIAILPGFAFAANGKLDTVRIPGGWWEARSVIEDRSGTTLILPFSAERQYTWNTDRAEQSRWSVDIARAYFPGTILMEDQRVIKGVTIPGVDPAAAAIRDSLGDGEAFLAALDEYGVTTVIIERGAAGPGAPDVQWGERLHAGGGITVWAVDGDAGTPPDDGTPDVFVIAADVLAALVALGAVVLWIVAGRRREDDGFDGGDDSGDLDGDLDGETDGEIDGDELAGADSDTEAGEYDALLEEVDEYTGETAPEPSVPDAADLPDVPDAAEVPEPPADPTDPYRPPTG